MIDLACAKREIQPFAVDGDHRRKQWKMQRGWLHAGRSAEAAAARRAASVNT
jgi:hypothetical protein